MRWGTVRIVLLLIFAFLVFCGVWTFWVPAREPGGKWVASAEGEWLAWSPDGRHIEYYAYPPHPGGGIYVARSDGSGGKFVVGDVIPAGWQGQDLLGVGKEADKTKPEPDSEAYVVAIDPQTDRSEPLGPRFRLPANSGRCWPSPSLSQAAVLRLDRDTHKSELLLASAAGETSKLAEFGLPDCVWDVSWLPDESALVVLTMHGIHVVDVDTGSKSPLLRCLDGAYPALGFYPPRTALAVSPKGGEVAFSVPGRDLPGRVLGWAAGKAWWNKGASFCNRWQTRHTRGVVYSVRLRDGKVREILRMPKGTTVGHLAWSPDGRRLAAVCLTWAGPSPGATIRVFDIPAAKPDDWRPVKEVLPGLRSGPDGANG